MQETWVQSLGQEDPLEQEMATHCSSRTWKVPWTEEPGGLQSMGSQRVGYDWSDSARMRINLGYGGCTFSLYHMACRSFNPQVFPVSSLWGFGKHRRQTAESSGQNHGLSYEANSSLIPSSTEWPQTIYPPSLSLTPLIMKGGQWYWPHRACVRVKWDPGMSTRPSIAGDPTGGTFTEHILRVLGSEPGVRYLVASRTERCLLLILPQRARW